MSPIESAARHFCALLERACDLDGYAGWVPCEINDDQPAQEIIRVIAERWKKRTKYSSESLMVSPGVYNEIDGRTKFMLMPGSTLDTQTIEYLWGKLPVPRGKVLQHVTAKTLIEHQRLSVRAFMRKDYGSITELNRLIYRFVHHCRGELMP